MVFNMNFNCEIGESIFNLILNIDHERKDGEILDISNSFVNYLNILDQGVFTIDSITFKRIKFYNILDKIRDILRPFYLNKYKYYVDREINYPEFLTIIRQICKFMKIPYSIQVKYLLNEKLIYYDINIKDYCECIKNRLPMNVSDSNTC